MMRRAVVQTASPVATCRRFGLHPDIYRRGSFHRSIFMASVKCIIPVLLSLSMEWIWIIIGVILAIVAIAGSILPLIPGPPVAYVGLLLQQLRDDKPFTINFLLLWAAIVVVSLILDYVIPIWGTKKFGGTKYGVWGCTLGFIAAFWLGPWGIIIGPFLGAFAGEMLAQQNSNIAFKAALGSFVGFLAGSFLKLVICFFMLYYILTSI